MLREITDKIEWETLHQARTIPSGDFLQSWNWGEFQASLGRKVLRFAGDGSLAQIVELPLPLGQKYWFCPKGPILGTGQWTVDNASVKELKAKAKAARAVFLRIEPPEDPTAMNDPLGVIAVRTINPSGTSIINLQKTEEELLAAMHSKTRYNIRVAEKHGVTVERHVDAAPVIDEVLKLFSETAARDKFNLHPHEYYRKQLAALGEKKTFVPGAKAPHLLVFTAGVEKKMLAAAVIMFDRETVTYLHGASSNEMRNVMAPYALHWAVMKRAKERNYKYYDLWGISDDQKSGWAGITRFKRGFGGEDVFSPGTFDLPVNKFWYSVYTLVRRWRG